MLKHITKEIVVTCLEAGLPTLTSPLKTRAPVDVQVPWEVLHHR